MKKRHGFVSNSSSSSFIVIFPRKPTSQKELHEMLFPHKEEVLPSPYDSNDVPSKVVSEIVWDDMKDKLSFPVEAIPEELASGWFEGQPNMNAYNLFGGRTEKEREQAELEWKRFDADTTRAAQTVSNEFLSKHFDKNAENVIFQFSYSDNDGHIGSVMEHGGTFNALPHLRISHH